jgi:hypothetical protein
MDFKMSGKKQALDQTFKRNINYFKTSHSFGMGPLQRVKLAALIL